jgi:sulfate adenylyltransferase subunit 1
MNNPGFFDTFAKEGGRVGSGTLGSGQGGVARCAGGTPHRRLRDRRRPDRLPATA